MTKLEKDNAVTVIAETRTSKGTVELFGGPYPEAGLYATAEFIAKNPNTIQASKPTTTTPPRIHQSVLPLRADCFLGAGFF